MNDRNKNLLLRIASVAALLPVCLFLLAKGGYWTAGLLSVGAAICAAEYYAIALKRLSAAAWVGVGAALAMPLFPVWAARHTGLPELASAHAGDVCFWWVAGLFFFFWIYHLIAGPLIEAPTRVGHLLTGLLYAGFGSTALSELRVRPGGLEWVIAALVVTWANDTAAYFAGQLFGRHKLYPQVSPHKTWEGLVGGLVGSVVGLFAYRALVRTSFVPADCIVLGVTGAVMGPLGDLCESLLKRSYGVKDSGKIIPGHGGLLDRVDALLFNAPLVFLYVHFVRRLLLGSVA